MNVDEELLSSMLCVVFILLLVIELYTCEVRNCLKVLNRSFVSIIT